MLPTNCDYFHDLTDYIEPVFFFSLKVYRESYKDDDQLKCYLKMKKIEDED